MKERKMKAVIAYIFCGWWYEGGLVNGLGGFKFSKIQNCVNLLNFTAYPKKQFK